MESLDRAFENVCELDLIFHFDEVSSLYNLTVYPFNLIMLYRYIMSYPK